MKNLLRIIIISSVIISGCDTKTTTNPVTTPTPATVAEKVDWLKVKAVITQRCQVCHSATPKDTSFGLFPGGVSFDTDVQIQAKAARINQRAVIEKSMPKNNKTEMTQEERDLLGKWFAAGAPIN
jgi:uncharacterized membrane protein